MRSLLLPLPLLFTLSSTLLSTAFAAELQLKQGEVQVPMPGRSVTTEYFKLEINTATVEERVKASNE
ncbi:hypothetical protein GCM10010919_09150 [Alishewanella longhuensis]|uniref:SIMPL domain-containing protein n=1 Tax=Alishewanella longhuensis TaxID=1091037 RepID=A0ABQ3KVR0_9ALTE|nr:hypothetical protein [Alishewanella longhuensis]GHG63448.1 hypothetical protein GCM10010919_09150 [Alishewanella longhuensis]